MLEKLNLYVRGVGVLLIPIALIVGMAGCTGDDGSYAGPPGHTPFQNSPPQNLEIRTWYDLDAVKDNLAGNHTLMNDLDSTASGYWELAGPIANQGKGWAPIGFVERFFWDSPFGCGGSRTDWYGLHGTFDGQGYEIRDLFIDRPHESGVGLFGVVDEGGVIKDTGAVNVTVIGEYYIGALVGRNRGSVSNSYSSGSVTGEQWGVGGLVGVNHGTVSNSYSTCNVIGSGAIGGLVGSSGFTVSDCYSTGDVTGSYDIGGLVGVNHDTASNSYYNYDEVLINGESVITIGALSNEDFCQWLAQDRFLDVNERPSQEAGYYLIDDVLDFKQLLAFGRDGSLKFGLTNDLDLGDEPDFYVPYLAGEFDGNGHRISNLSLNFDFASNVGLFGYLASGGKVTRVGIENVDVTGDGNIGGLVGRSYGTVSNSYSSGSVTGATDVGGLVGWNGGTVSNSYSSGSVTGYRGIGGLVGMMESGDGKVSNSYSSVSVTGTEDVGGLVGEYHEGAVSNSFWDAQISGQTRSDGGTGKTTAQMKNVATFSRAGWNIVAVADPGTHNPSYIWNIVDGVTYPFLSWQAILQHR
jgi:hypothetical protein